MRVRWARVGLRRGRFRRRRRHQPWQLAMVSRFLLLMLLSRTCPWARASELLPPAAALPLPSAQVANGCCVVVIVMVTIIIASKVSQLFNRSSRQTRLSPTFSRLLQCCLFVWSGCYGLVALYFLARGFNFKANSTTKYGLFTSEDHLETASMHSDEETIYKMHLYK